MEEVIITDGPVNDQAAKRSKRKRSERPRTRKRGKGQKKDKEGKEQKDTNTTSNFGPVARGDKLHHESIEYLWSELIPMKAATVLTGITGAGKSTFLAELASAVTTGRELPGGPGRNPGGVIWLASEEHPSLQVKPRLLSSGADMRRVRFPGWDEKGFLAKKPTLPTSIEWLAEVAWECEARILIIDPITSFLDRDYQRADDVMVKTLVERLGQLAFSCGLCCLYLKHPRKGKGGGVRECVSGSMEWVNTPRAGLIVSEHPSDPTRRVVASMKRIQGPMPRSWEFGLVDPVNDPRIIWHGRSEYTADDLHVESVDSIEKSMLEEAMDLIRDRLEEGQRDAKYMSAAAIQAMVSGRTMFRAKKQLGVTSHQVVENEERKSVWRKPVGGWKK